MKLAFALLIALVSSIARAERCGSQPATADWFFLGNPPVAYATAAGRVLKALRRGLDPADLVHEPACLHVTVLDDLAKRSAQLRGSHASRGRGLASGTVGFHLAQLGADDTVFVTPNASVPLEVVMLHESLHALSHRFTFEARSKHREFELFKEAVTQYITRELAVLVLGYKPETIHSGYDEAVRFVTALMARLGPEGPRLLADSYLRDGYDSFERAVDMQLGISLASAARDLQRRDFGSAMARLHSASR